MHPFTKIKDPNRPRVHVLLAHSYLFFLVALLVGLFFDFIFAFRIFDQAIMMPIGMIFLLIGSFLILWAQRTSRKLDKENITKTTFMKGPYCFTRTPTHWGLTLLMIGFGLVANAVFIILFAIISFIVCKLVFLKKEEEVLEKKYGVPYLEYKKIVRF